MSKMAEIGSVTEIEGGVCVNVKGDASYQYIKDMVDGCAAGKHCDCDCDCDKMMSAATLAVEGTDGDVSIHIKHAAVTAELMRQNLAKCGMDVSGKSAKAPATR